MVQKEQEIEGGPEFQHGPADIVIEIYFEGLSELKLRSGGKDKVTICDHCDARSPA